MSVVSVVSVVSVLSVVSECLYCAATLGASSEAKKMRVRAPGGESSPPAAWKRRRVPWAMTGPGARSCSAMRVPGSVCGCSSLAAFPCRRLAWRAGTRHTDRLWGWRCARGGELQLELISARGAVPSALRAVHPGSVVRGQRENTRALGVGSGGREGRWSRVRKKRRAKKWSI